MKTLKKFLITLIGLSTIISTASADTVFDSSKTIYTPERPGLIYKQYELGLPYPSFNNYTNNTAMSGNSSYEDERKFLIGKHCKDEDCTGGYTNTVKDTLQDGDKVRFMIYFHNNAEDLYDGGETFENSEDAKKNDAKNVMIGVSVAENTDTELADIQRPVGFIYADNNQYRTDINAPETIITYESLETGNLGNDVNNIPGKEETIVRTATDDMGVFMREIDNMKLKPIPGSAKMYTNAYTGDITGTAANPQTLTFDTETGPQSVNISAHYVGDSMWVHFDRLPGCFRYSGFVYFDAIVEKQPEKTPEICTLFDIELGDTKFYNGELAHKITIKDLGFGSTPIPEGTKIHWGTTDSNGKFWLGNESTDAGTWVDPNFDPTFPASELWSPQTITTNPDDYVYYIGKGQIYADVDTVDDSLESIICNDVIQVPIPDAVCEEIFVDHPETITEGTLSWFRAEATDTDDEEYGSTITYSVTPGYGYFFTTKPNEYKDNTAPMVYETDNRSTLWDALGPDNFVYTGEGLANTIANENTPTKGYSIDPKTVQPLVSSIATGNLWDNGTDLSPTTNPGMDSKAINSATSFGKTSAFDLPIIGTDVIPEIKILPTSKFPIVNDPSYLYNTSATSTEVKMLPGKLPIVNDTSYLYDTSAASTPIEPASEEVIDYVLSSITVEPGDIVYFYAKKPGTNVITVKTTDSNEPGCEKTYSILPAPKKQEKLECGSAKLTAVTTSKQYPVCMKKENGKVALNISFTSTDEQLINTKDVRVKWTSTEGVFDTQPGDQPTIIQNQFIGGTTTFYEGNGSVTAELYTLEGEPYEDSACISSIPACDTPPVCKELNLNYKPDFPMVGDKVALIAKGTDTFNNILPDETLVDWTNTANGTFGGKTSITTPINESVVFTDSKQAGEIKAAISKNDPLYSEICKSSVPISPAGLTCTDFITKITKINGGQQVDTLVPGQKYELKATATYSASNPNGTITYSIDPIIGFFYQTVKEDPNNPMGTGTKELPPFMKYLVDTAVDFAKSNNIQIFESEIAVKEGEQLFLVTYDGLTSSVKNALTMQATGYANCADSYDLVVIPPEQEFACTDLEITSPDNGWDIDENDDSQNVKIKVKTTEGGSFEDLWYHWEVKGGVDEVKWEDDSEDDNDGDDDVLTEKGDLTNKFEWEADSGEPEVFVWASYDGNPDHKIDACSDYVHADFDEEDEEGNPKIIKEAYVRDVEDSDDLLNIGSRSSTKELTYIYTFTAGDLDIDWTDIFDEDFSSGNIFGDKSDNGKKGSLSYEGMRINVKPDDFDAKYYKNNYKEDSDDEDDGDYEDYDGYTILETNRYKEEKDDDDYFSEENFGNNDDYEDRYSCDNDQGGVCIDLDKYKYDDFEEVADAFTQGDNIRFENIEKDMTIMIKVQVENHTVITSSYCKELTTAEGCGEEFNNEVKFKTSEGDKGSSDARIIAVCPYVLTRSGGDVFFHDVIDTGIDISYCSPVKSSTGTGITKTPTKIPEVTNTGNDGNTDPDSIGIKLSMPTHDVCQFSNSQSNSIEEYKNPLANFSSTICELRAEISKNWEETYIKDAITANIERVARWGENLDSLGTDQKDPGARIITNGNDLSKAENAGNGIFIREGGNLTIDLGNNPKSLSEGTSTDIPAAKTFIVINGNLNIKSDINADYSFENATINPKDVPSYAFIVIGGNIIIDNNVKRIDGVLMAVDYDLNSDEDGGGNIIPSEPITTNILTINGSMFGNVVQLFGARQGVGDPRKDEGSVTIRYDERVLLNTPPGISELVDVATTLVP